MPVTGPLSHIDISVGYPEKSIPFYHALLTNLGYRRWDTAVWDTAGWETESPKWSGDNPSRATWGIKYSDGSRFDIEVRPARPDSKDRRYDRYEPGPHHLAFHASSEQVVNQVYDAVLSAGITAHPFAEGESISDRTMAAMETVVQGQNPTAIWIDALCVPV